MLSFYFYCLFIYLTLRFKFLIAGQEDRQRTDEGGRGVGGWGEWRPPCCRFRREVNPNQTNDRRTIGVEGGSRRGRGGRSRREKGRLGRCPPPPQPSQMGSGYCDK